MRFGKTAAYLAFTFLLLSPGGSRAQGLDVKPHLSPDDLPVVMSAYVDGVIELRQFLTACGKSDPARWEEGAGLFVASVGAAGIDASLAADFRTRLAAGMQGAATYDCTGEVAALRAEAMLVADWVTYHTEALTRLSIVIVSPPAENDPRLAKVQAVFAEHVPAQARMLRCMALTQPDFYLLSYADWNGLLDRAAEAMASAGFDAQIVETLVGPARPIRLIGDVPDRQAAIADCMADGAWMSRGATLQAYAFPGDVREALGQPR